MRSTRPGAGAARPGRRAGSRALSGAAFVAAACVATACFATGTVRGGERLFRSLEVRRIALESTPTYLALADLDQDGVLDVIALETDAGSMSVILADGPGAFRPPASYAVGSSPLHSATGNLDGVAGLDVVVADSGSAAIVVFLNLGDGRLVERARPGLPGLPRAVRVRDLDGDGRLDAAVGVPQSGQTGALAVFPGDGLGGFEEPTVLDVGDNPHWLVDDDFDRDGDCDLVVFHSLSAAVFVNPGNGSLEFEYRVELPGFPRFGASADFDGDGLPDVVATTQAPGAPIVLLPNVAGRLAAFREVAATGVGGDSWNRPIVVRDLDRDGSPDVITPIGRSSSYGVGCFRGLGDGTFSVLEELWLGEHFAALEVADLDSDGDDDVLVSRRTPPGIAILVADGPGLVDPRTRVPLEWRPRKVLDRREGGDGAPDLVVLAQEGVTVLRREAGGGWLRTGAWEAAGLASDLAVGDLDGIPGDEAVVSDSVGGTVTVLRVDDAGRPAVMGERVLGGSPSRVALPDLDGDGRLDILVADLVLPRVLMLGVVGPPDEWTVQASPAPPLQRAIATADADGDGDDDVVVAARGALEVLLNDGTGALRDRRKLSPPGEVAAIATADVDRDGAPDVLGANTGAAGGFVLSGLRGPGDPTLTILDAPGQLGALEARDADGDGQVEVLATQSFPEPLVLVWRWPPSGGGQDVRIEVLETHPVGAEPASVQLADLDGDKALDAVTADEGTSALSILQGTRALPGPRFRRGDANVDAKLDLSDAVHTLSALFLGAARLSCEDAADANDDGSLNISDGIYWLGHLFLGGPPPPAPYPEAGGDPTEDPLGCEVR